MENIYFKTNLFNEITEDEIKECIKCSLAKIKTYEKDEIIFTEHNFPSMLYILIEGSIAICKGLPSGKISIITTIEKQGEAFGEVYLFLDNKKYDYYSIAMIKSKVLEIPKEFFYKTCAKCCQYHSKLIYNMLNILAQKAHTLTTKINILSSGNLRQKIVSYIIENIDKNKTVNMKMNREELASYLNVTRPSLSRELIKMKEEGLIKIKNKSIVVDNVEALEVFL